MRGRKAFMEGRLLMGGKKTHGAKHSFIWAGYSLGVSLICTSPALYRTFQLTPSVLAICHAVWAPFVHNNMD